MDYESPDTAPVLGSPPDAENLVLYCTDEGKYYYTALSKDKIISAFNSRAKGASTFTVGAKGYEIICNCSFKYRNVYKKQDRCPSLLDMRMGSKTNGRWAKKYDPDEDKKKEAKRAEKLAKAARLRAIQKASPPKQVVKPRRSTQSTRQSPQRSMQQSPQRSTRQSSQWKHVKPPSTEVTLMFHLYTAVPHELRQALNDKFGLFFDYDAPGSCVVEKKLRGYHDLGKYYNEELIDPHKAAIRCTASQATRLVKDMRNYRSHWARYNLCRVATQLNPEEPSTRKCCVWFELPDAFTTAPVAPQVVAKPPPTRGSQVAPFSMFEGWPSILPAAPSSTEVKTTSSMVNTAAMPIGSAMSSGIPSAAMVNTAMSSAESASAESASAESASTESASTTPSISDDDDVFGWSPAPDTPSVIPLQLQPPLPSPVQPPLPSPVQPPLPSPVQPPLPSSVQPPPGFVADPLRDFLNDCQLPQYYDNFKNEGFELLEDIADLDEADLHECGITARGHRKRIMKRVEAMSKSTE